MADDQPIRRITSTQDLTGRTFGRLVVIGFEAARRGKRFWRCRCECGAETVAPTTHLNSGNTKSCGCWSREVLASRAKHGGARSAGRTPEYKIWCSMLTRCNNQRSKSYRNYGGRGIRVCDAWASDFEAFLRDVGRRPSPKHTLDRVDNDKGYGPDNCRWATWHEQANNRRANRVVEFMGRRLTLANWARELGIECSTLATRLRDGWAIERAFTEPLVPRSDNLPHPAGEMHPNAKLTKAEVDLIRQESLTMGTSRQELAKRFGVHRRTIQLILQGKAWV